MRQALFALGLAAAAVFGTGSPPADAAPSPVVLSAVEGRDAARGRNVLIVYGTRLSLVKSWSLVRPDDTPVDGATVSIKSNTSVVLALPDGITAGSYKVRLTMKKPPVVDVPIVLSLLAAPAETIELGQLSSAAVADIADADTLRGEAPSDLHDASKLTGTIDSERFDAAANLIAAGKIGPAAGQVAAGDHEHDERYPLSKVLSTAGKINSPANPVHWTQLAGVPTGFEDGVDDGVAPTTLSSAGTVNSAANPVDWTKLKGVPSGFADGADDGVLPATLSAAGTINAAANPVDWTKLKGVPAGLADGVDNGSNWTLSGGDVWRAAGRVGIGTASPAAGLHAVHADGALFSGTFGSGSIPATGAGTRMMWYPAKAAVRAGRAYGTTWDASNVGEYSTAMGAGTTASGSHSTAFGEETSASGSHSTALGLDTTASGAHSIAFGELTTASGSESTSLGYSCLASGRSALAAGRWAVASGTESTALGNGTKASAASSTALGESTLASGQRATAMGYTTTAQAYASVALGQFNVVAGNTGSWVATDPILVVGNGTGASARANAFTLLKNGNLTIAGTLTQNSDARLKEDVKPLAGVLARLRDVRGVSYRFKYGDGPAGAHIGLLAQEVEKAFPELVTKDSEGRLSVAYGNFAAVLLEATKEQQAVIESQRTEIEALRSTLAAMDERLKRVEAGR
jgi:hypothetical protein